MELPENITKEKEGKQEEPKQNLSDKNLEEKQTRLLAEFSELINSTLKNNDVLSKLAVDIAQLGFELKRKELEEKKQNKPEYQSLMLKFIESIQIEIIKFKKMLSDQTNQIAAFQFQKDELEQRIKDFKKISNDGNFENRDKEKKTVIVNGDPYDVSHFQGDQLSERVRRRGFLDNRKSPESNNKETTEEERIANMTEEEMIEYAKQISLSEFK